MKTIYKFALQGIDTFISVPPAATVVHVGDQYGQLQAWVELDTSEMPTQRQLSVYNTGANVSDNQSHVGTVILDGGNTVVHVYESK